MIYLVLLFTILFFILAWRRLDLAVMFLIAGLPAYLIRFNILGLPSTILEVMIGVVFLVWLLKNYRQIFKNFKSKIGHSLKINNRYPFDWEMVWLLLISLAAVGVAGFGASSFGIWKAYFFEPVLVFIVIMNVMRGRGGRGKILWSLAIGALAVSILAVYQKITGQFIDNSFWAAVETRRVVSFFGYPNAVGLYLGPLILVMTGWLAYARSARLKFIFISLTIILSVLAIYFAKSKGALLGVAAGLVAFGLAANKRLRWTTVAVLIVLAVGLTACQPARQIISETIHFKTLSGQIRKVGFEETWRMLKDGRFLTGAGLANYQASIAPYHAEGFFIKNDDPDWLKKIRASAEYRQKMWQPLEIYLYPHNIALNFWSELGLAGLLLFIWIIGKYFWLGIKNLSKSENRFMVIGLIGAGCAIVVHGLVDVPYFKNDLAVIFWLLIAIMSMINLENRYEEKL